MMNQAAFNELVDKRMDELSKKWNGDFKALVRELVCLAGKDEQDNYKLWGLTDFLVGQDCSSLSARFRKTKKKRQICKN